MTCTKFKLTTVAALVFAATNANAALYTIIEVDSPVSGNEVHGVAIQDSSNSTLGTLGCFDENATASECDGYLLAGEARQGVEGLSHREEVPFGSDNAFYYAQTDDGSDYFRSYCTDYLGYDNCGTSGGWGDQYWSAYERERNGESNFKAFVEGSTGQIEPSGLNTVINSLDSNAQAIGNSSTSVVERNQAFPSVTVGGDVTSTPVQSRAWATDGVYTVGSVSTARSNENEGSTPFNTYNSKAAIWDSSYTQLLDWDSKAKEEEDELLAQGSLRDFAVDGTKIYAVGYNTYDDQHMNATVYISDTNALPTSWTKRVIDGSQVGDDDTYANSTGSSINKHLNIVGQAKFYNKSNAENGAFPDKLFVSTYEGNDTWSSAKFLNDGSQSIFFNGAGGKIGRINNFNEIVGQIDSETIRESGGKQRRHRGFIYPYQATGTEASRASLFNNKAWWLDDLTNDGNASGINNRYRIIDASDINDAGVISATAIRCTVNGSARPYDTTAHNSYCNNAESSSTTEEIVAVKLIPKQGSDASNIQARGTDEHKVDREGAGLSWLGLTVLGLLGFRRKFK